MSSLGAASISGDVVRAQAGMREIFDAVRTHGRANPDPPVELTPLLRRYCERSLETAATFLDVQGTPVESNGAGQFLGLPAGCNRVLVVDAVLDIDKNEVWLGLATDIPGVTSYIRVGTQTPTESAIRQTWRPYQYTQHQLNLLDVYHDAIHSNQVVYDTPVEITTVANASFEKIRNAAQRRFLNASGLTLTKPQQDLGLTGNGTGVYVKEARLNSDKTGVWIALCENVDGPIVSYVLVDREARDLGAIRTHLSPQQWDLVECYREATELGSTYLKEAREITNLTRRAGSAFHPSAEWLNVSGEPIGVQLFTLGIAKVTPDAKLYLKEGHRDGEGRGVWVGLATSNAQTEKVASYVLVSHTGTTKPSKPVLELTDLETPDPEAVDLEDTEMEPTDLELTDSGLLERWPVPPPFNEHQLNQFRAYTEAREHGSVVYDEPLEITRLVRRSNGVSSEGFLNADGIPTTQGAAIGIGKNVDVFIKEAHEEPGTRNVWLGLTTSKTGPIISFTLIDSEATTGDAILNTFTPLQFNLHRIYADAKRLGAIVYNPPHPCPDPCGKSGLTRETFLSSEGKALKAVFGIGLKNFAARTEVTKAVYLEPDRIVLDITGYNVSGTSKSTRIVVHPDKIVNTKNEAPTRPVQMLRGKVLDEYVGHVFATQGLPYLRESVFGVSPLVCENLKPNFIDETTLVHVKWGDAPVNVIEYMLRYDRLKRSGVSKAQSVQHLLASDTHLDTLRGTLSLLQGRGLMANTTIDALTDRIGDVAAQAALAKEIELITTAANTGDEVWLSSRDYKPQLKSGGTTAAIETTADWTSLFRGASLAELQGWIGTTAKLYHPFDNFDYLVAVAQRLSWLYDNERGDPADEHDKVKQVVRLVLPALSSLPPGVWKVLNDADLSTVPLWYSPLAEGKIAVPQPFDLERIYKQLNPALAGTSILSQILTRRKPGMGVGQLVDDLQSGFVSTLDKHLFWPNDWNVERLLDYIARSVITESLAQGRKIFESFRGSSLSYEWNAMIAVLKGVGPTTIVVQESSTVLAGAFVKKLEELGRVLRA